MASLYLESQLYRPIQQPQVAFLRFLETFARDQWSTDPVLVNFNNEMTRESDSLSFILSAVVGPRLCPFYV
jgi:U3 small nucleolar RNA-associated protein 22